VEGAHQLYKRFPFNSNYVKLLKAMQFLKPNYSRIKKERQTPILLADSYNALQIPADPCRSLQIPPPRKKNTLPTIPINVAAARRKYVTTYIFQNRNFLIIYLKLI